MAYILKPVPFPQLVNWVQSEFKNEGSVFGIRKENFFKPTSCDVQIFVKKISTPIGPSAGPCTQLAQNILACYLAGARYFELKTVQTMDGEELRKAVSRPSINAVDVGYNVEWSSELTVKQAMEEYIKAWFLCNVFAVEYDISEENDFVFNMSVGYTFDGISSPKINSFIEGLKNAKNTEIWQQCHDYLSANILSFSKFTKADLDGISPEISKGITISTFYNCPSIEIEKITAWLLGEKSLNTFIKLNPTLLGYETARSLLDEIGYGDISFSDFHFKNDLQFNDAARILRNLKALAYRLRLGFGVKLTNTFPVDVKHKELPGQEMFMSGRALYPLSLLTVKKIVDIFHSDLMISYSGGADFFNLKPLLETGIRPITMTTNILKPGGISKFFQLAHEASLVAQTSLFAADIDAKALNNMCKKITEDSHYREAIARRADVRKKPEALPLFDCSIHLKTFCETCVEACPNRANVSVEIKTKDSKAQSRQILHIDSICNECGNCASFCPYTGRPYKDKPTLFYSEEDFNESESAGFFKNADNSFTVRMEDKSIVKHKSGGKSGKHTVLPPQWAALIDAIADPYGYLLNL